MSDSKGAAIRQKLKDLPILRNYMMTPDGKTLPTNYNLNDEDIDAILAILAQEVERELEKLKLMTDYNRHFCTGETLPKNEQWVAEHKLKVQGFNDALKVMEIDIDKAIERLG